MLDQANALGRVHPLSTATTELEGQNLSLFCLNKVRSTLDKGLDRKDQNSDNCATIISTKEEMGLCCQQERNTNDA